MLYTQCKNLCLRSYGVYLFALVISIIALLWLLRLRTLNHVTVQRKVKEEWRMRETSLTIIPCTFEKISSIHLNLDYTVYINSQHGLKSCSAGSLGTWFKTEYNKVSKSWPASSPMDHYLHYSLSSIEELRLLVTSLKDYPVRSSVACKKLLHICAN